MDLCKQPRSTMDNNNTGLLSFLLNCHLKSVKMKVRIAAWPTQWSMIPQLEVSHNPATPLQKQLPSWASNPHSLSTF